jgi:hypothetical protein
MAFCLFYAFGWVWANFLRGFGPREQMAFWPTLFLFGYALAGFDPVAGVFAGLAMGLNAIVTPAVIPALLPWLIG